MAEQPTNAQIVQAVEDAQALRHPHRSMRVTLECGHLRLMPHIGTVMGIGAMTACNICPPADDGYATARTVVNVEETGHLNDSWLDTWRARQAPASVPVCLPSLQERCGSCHRCQTPASEQVTTPRQKGSSVEAGERS